MSADVPDEPMMSQASNVKAALLLVFVCKGFKGQVKTLVLPVRPAVRLSFLTHLDCFF